MNERVIPSWSWHTTMNYFEAAGYGGLGSVRLGVFDER